MTLRGRILSMYGVPAEQAKPPNSNSRFPPLLPAMMAMQGAEGWGGFGGSGGADPSDFKSKLQQCISKRSKRSLVKGELNYTVSQDEAGNGFWCVVQAGSTELLAKEYWSATVAASKRAAEHLAAKAAMLAEFPEAAMMSDMEAWWSGKGGPPAAGVKRKAAAITDASAAVDAKSRLMQAVQLLLTRPVTKGEVVYETSQADAEGKSWVGTVSIPAHDPSSSWQGEPADSQKQAMMNAAEAALAALKDTLTPLEEERKAKKNKEALEKLKKAHADKKAAAQAEGATNGN